MHIKLHCFCLNQNVKKSKTKANQFNPLAVNFVIVLVLVFKCAFLYRKSYTLAPPPSLSISFSHQSFTQTNIWTTLVSLWCMSLYIHVLKHIYIPVCKMNGCQTIMNTTSTSAPSSFSPTQAFFSGRFNFFICLFV